jgi:iron-sulfur cluster repair protein YtfE (RIC family)
MDETLTAALEREHQEIDAGLESFVEGLDAGELRHEQLERAADALRRHIYLEEEILFPPLRAAGMLAPVLVMLREHAEIWRTLDALELEVGPGTAADTAGDRCRGLLSQLETHNAKEEPIIYPQGDAVLSDQAKRDLHAFIDSGRMPLGWVCAQARPRA